MSTPAKTWILTDHGDLINLEFLTKVMWGGNFVTPQDTAVFLYHGIGAGLGSVVKYIYSTAAEAENAYNIIRDQMLALGMVTDLRASVAELRYIKESSGAVAGGDPVIFVGTNFLPASIPSINGIPCTGITYINSSVLYAITPAGIAGLVDADVDGQVLTNSFTYV